MFEHGVDVGYRKAERDQAARFAPVAAHVAEVTGGPSQDELRARRAVPGGEAYLASVLRNGGTEYGGVGRPRVIAPVEVLRILVDRVNGDGGRAA